ncbi:MAG: hypothetical protein AAFY60_20400 [Myxococcota bacterium]
MRASLEISAAASAHLGTDKQRLNAEQARNALRAVNFERRRLSKAPEKLDEFSRQWSGPWRAAIAQGTVTEQQALRYGKAIAGLSEALNASLSTLEVREAYARATADCLGSA